MKRNRFGAAVALALGGLMLLGVPHAKAGLFGLGHKAPATPTPSPSPLPTATPVPSDILIPRLKARLKAHPTDRQSAIELAGAYLGIGRADQALSLTQQLLQNGNKSAQVYYLDGFAQQQVGNNSAALSDFQNASDLDPTNVGILTQLADMYAQTQQFALAERVAKRGVIFNKTDPQAYLTLGAIYADEQKFDLARAQFAKAEAVAPGDPTALVQVARTYQQQKNIPKALAAIRSALALDPRNLDILLLRASLFASQHNDVKTALAFDDAEFAANSDHQRAQVLVQKSSYFASEKKYPQAFAILQKALLAFPKSALVHGSLGDLYANQKNIKDARIQWQAALAIDPTDAVVLDHLAQDAIAQHNTVLATTYLTALVKAQPSAQSFAMLGQIYFLRHIYAKARAACESSFQVDREPDTLGCIAASDYYLHDYGDAAQIFDALDRNAPGFLDRQPEMLFVAAKTYNMNHDRSKTLQSYQRLLRIVPKGSPAYRQVVAKIRALGKKP